MTEAKIFGVASGRVAVFSSKSPDKEGVNEDAAAIIPVTTSSAVLAVADGLGGHASGKHASSLAIHELKQAIEKVAAEQGDLREAILNGFEEANRAVLDLRSGAATTLAVVEMQERTIRPYHVGDTMIVATGQQGKLALQTVSHSPVGYAVESGLLEESEAMAHEERHVVSNVIGADDMRIEVGATLEIKPHDTLIIASDGVYDNLTMDEVVQCIRKGKLKTVMASLSGQVKERMLHPVEGFPSKPDDMTFVLYRPHRR